MTLCSLRTVCSALSSSGSVVLAPIMGEPYLEKAERTGRLIVPSKLGAVPDEAYDMELHELSLAGARALSLRTKITPPGRRPRSRLPVVCSSCAICPHSATPWPLRRAGNMLKTLDTRLAKVRPTWPGDAG